MVPRTALLYRGPMRRRDFLSGTTLSAIVGVAGAGCAGAGYRLSPTEGQAALERLDRGLEAARGGARTLEGLGPLAADAEQLVRLGLEAFVVADVARSIPPDAELSPGLAARLQEELPVLGRATYHYTSLLAGLSPAGRARVEGVMREQPDAPMRVAEWIDTKAAEFGVDYESRIKLREVATNLGTRARRQSLRAVIDDTVGKVERVVAQKGEPIGALVGALVPGGIAVGLLGGATVGGTLLIAGLIVLIVGLAQNS